MVLCDDGTWRYIKDSTTENDEAGLIKLNPYKFSKTANQTFVLKSNTVNVGVFINPQKWTVSAHKDNEVNIEYRFGLKSGNDAAVFLSEKTPIDVKNMGEIALINAQKAASDAVITSQEYRMVNGIKVLCVSMSATIKGIKLKYLGYYYSNSKGTIQLLCYSSDTLYPEAKNDFEAFLNGLVLI